MVWSLKRPSLGLLLLISTSSAAVAEPDGSWSSTTGSTNGVSTGVGNAGSFGIGSGTADSLSNGNGSAIATATSDGVHEANTYDIVDNSISAMSVQDLETSTANNQVTYNAGANPQDSPLPTGSNSSTGSSFSNFAGILANGWNAGPASNVVSINNLSVNGGLAQK